MRTSEEVQLLSVLEAIGENSRVSQRDLSRITGLNLAKVNQLLKKLTENEAVELHSVSLNPDKLRYHYVLTPRGFAEKSRLTVRFAARIRGQYSDAIYRLRLSFIQLGESGVSRIVLLGLNEVADMAIEVIRNMQGLEIVALVDQDRAGGSHRGYPVVALGAIDALEFDRLIPCDDGDCSLDDIAERIGIAKEKVWLV